MENEIDLMEMNENGAYLPPKIEVVAMKVERGFAGSCTDADDPELPSDGGKCGDW